MKNLLRAAAIAIAFAAVSFPFAAIAHDSTNGKKEAFGRLTVDQVNELVATKSAYIFDNNGAESYAKGHVPTAKLVAYDGVTASVLPADKDAKLVFYCADEHCGACHVAATAAVNLGYKNVFIMPAGIMGWKAKQKVEV